MAMLAMIVLTVQIKMYIKRVEQSCATMTLESQTLLIGKPRMWIWKTIAMSPLMKVVISNLQHLRESLVTCLLAGLTE